MPILVNIYDIFEIDEKNAPLKYFWKKGKGREMIEKVRMKDHPSEAK